MTGDGQQRGPVRPAVAVALATVGFFALLIFGLGMLSLLTDRDVVAVPGLGQIPGVAATAAATLAFAGGLVAALRRPHPSFWAALWIAGGVLAAYAVVLTIAAIATGAALGDAVAAAGGVLASGFAVVIAAAAAVAAWSGIALVRTRAARPRWPWESDADE